MVTVKATTKHSVQVDETSTGLYRASCNNCHWKAPLLRLAPESAVKDGFDHRNEREHV